MGAVKELIMELQEAVNPDHGEIVVYINERGWYSWAPARFWDNPNHEHYRSARREIGRSHDLYEMLAAVHAFNQMNHGATHETY